MVLIPIKLPRFRPGQNLGTILLQAFGRQNLSLNNGDVVAVASKVVSISEGRIVRLDEVQSSTAAKRLAKKWSVDERLACIVLDEADAIVGGVKGFLLTVKNKILTANAGVDLKNSPPGTATLWPKNPDISAKEIRRLLNARYKVGFGVEIVDSRVTPMRLGTIGLAIGVSGFLPVRDERGKPDIYGRRPKVTLTNVADDLAASAHLLMGETDERVGAVVIRNAPVHINQIYDSKRAILGMDRCLISSNLVGARSLAQSLLS